MRYFIDLPTLNSPVWLYYNITLCLYLFLADKRCVCMCVCVCVRVSKRNREIDRCPDAQSPSEGCEGITAGY